MNLQRLRLMRPLFAFRSIGNNSTIPSEAVVIADDGTVVCWHPEKHFPYEYTKPLPVEEAQDNSVFCRQANEAKTVFQKKHPEVMREELAQITFTTKHRWFPRSRDKRAKKTPMDREYL